MATDFSIRVLLVDDDPLFTKVVRRALKGAPAGPFEVVVATSVSDAIAVLSRGETDVAIVDLGLPDVSEPLEAVDRLVGFSAAVPVVVLTGRVNPTLGLQAVQCGAHDFLTKTELSPETLGRALRYAVERTRLFEQQRALVAKNPDAILILNERAEPQFVNPAAERMFEGSMATALAAVAQFLTRRQGEFDLDTERGRVTLEAVITEIIWTGRPGFLVTVRDTTARTRTAELRAMISHADKLASLGQLAADVVRTIEAPIMRARDGVRRAQGLLDDVRGATDAASDELVQVAHALEAIKAYVGQLRNYGHMDRKVSEVDLVRVAHLALEIVDRGLASTVQTRLAPVPRIYADGGLLCHALVNVLTNAGDAIREQVDGQIILSTWSSETHVGLSVRDNGPGVAAKDRDNVFRPFFSTKPAGAGAGLGLTVAADIVRSHYGEVRLTSEPEDTTVEFVLPRRGRSG